MGVMRMGQMSDDDDKIDGFELVIFKAQIGGESQDAVNLREIHQKVLSRQDFSDWAKSRLKDCGAVDGADYLVHKFMDNPRGGRPIIDYHVTMDIAKHCAMLEKNRQGFAVRQYLIDVEKNARRAVPLTGSDLVLAVREIFAPLSAVTAATIKNTTDIATLQAEVETLKSAAENGVLTPFGRAMLDRKIYAKVREKCRNTRRQHADDLGIPEDELETKCGWYLEIMIRDVMLKRYGGYCFWSGKYFTDLDDIWLDIRNPGEPPYYHINVDWISAEMNRRKQRRSAAEFRTVLAREGLILCALFPALPVGRPDVILDVA